MKKNEFNLKAPQLHGSIWMKPSSKWQLYYYINKIQNNSVIRKNTEFESKKCKQNAKKQNPFFFCFFWQNKNYSGSGDVVSAPKRKTFEAVKKNVLGRGGTS